MSTHTNTTCLDLELLKHPPTAVFFADYEVLILIAYYERKYLLYPLLIVEFWERSALQNKDV